MEERRSALVLVDDGERRARDASAAAKAARKTAREGGLSHAERAREGEHIAAAELLGKLFADRLGLLRAVRQKLHGFASLTPFSPILPNSIAQRVGLYNSFSAERGRNVRLQTGKIVLKYIENFVRREREAVNRFRDFLSDVVRQSDMVLLSLCTVSTLYGMVLIASATHFRNTFKYVAIQGFGLLLGVLLYFLLSSIDVSEVGKKWKWLLAFNFGFILLLRTPFGLTRNGNRAWLGVNDIGKRLGVGFLENFPITVQPAEIVKITFIILLARQLALLQEKRDLRSFTNVIQPTAHAGAMFVFYYILSKDAGSGLVYLFVFLCMAFAAGFALRWLFLGVGGAVGAFLAAWNLGLLRGDWYDRIKVILDHSYQPEKKGFQQTRGMLALGSGKLTGQGLFQGTQTQSSAKWSLPERQTDFIFCVCGEELGFIGCLLIIVLLLAIIVRCLIVAREAPSRMESLVCVGMAGMLIFQTIANIGMCLFLMPVIGLTLPFFSYGGSSIVTLFAAMGVVSGIKKRSRPEWLIN